MIDGEARIKAGITCACSRCDTSTSLQRRVCRCILTSGRRAPSSHPARCSWCHRRTVQTVALKIARFPPFLDPLTRQESAAWPPPSLHLPEKCFYLELPPPPPLSPPPPPPRPLGNQWSHDMERLLVISSICFHSRGGKCASGIRLWSPLQRHRLSLFPVCARGRAMIHSACVLKTEDVTKLHPLSWTNPD